jgi:hypothetical protein
MEGKQMRKVSLVCVMLVVLTGGMALNCSYAQTTESIYGSNLGVYKALAEVALELDRIGDHERAAKVAACIEVMWDGRLDDRQRPAAPSKRFTPPEASLEVDEAMDRFIQPLKEYKAKVPNHEQTAQSYQAYLDSLNKAGSIWKK